ncbi:hypothetical protein XELAEV_18030946mg [Xenopus laevis]|uniref:1-alkyl-2-acetylglycerophosphocholine esterase n=1 Tax=Xenopus laevis TaxID=8355 RepID=A0A974CLU7_XENLA|nr:hypothetical protein XELAEV_18030946mg [Xenopus laevis]
MGRWDWLSGSRDRQRRQSAQGTHQSAPGRGSSRTQHGGEHGPRGERVPGGGETSRIFVAPGPAPGSSSRRQGTDGEESSNKKNTSTAEVESGIPARFIIGCRSSQRTVAGEEHHVGSGRQRSKTAVGSAGRRGAGRPEQGSIAGGSISVWLLGHSYISWARRRAAVKKSGPQLGFPEGQVNIHWFGVPGLRWPGVWPTLLRNVRSGRRPDVLLIHAGGNDMGLRSQRELVLIMKQDLDKIRHLFPDLILVWSEMVPRLVWRYARNGEKMDRSRVKMNKLMASFVRKFGGIVIRHSNLDDKMPAYYGQDGVHLSELGNSFFTLALMEGIERALGLLSGESCRA